MRGVSLLAALIVCGCSTNRAAESDAAPKPKSTTSSAVITDASGKTTADLFHGKFAGVEAYATAQGGFRIKIRNSGALNAEGGDPIYVVDGLEVSAPDGTLYLDPNNIVKIEVERVSTLYGIRGSNGVVKITTKRK
jgi:hypothetical protein